MHDALALPSRFTEQTSADLQSRLQTLQDSVNNLQKENHELRQRIASDSLGREVRSEDEIESLIDQAVERTLEELENSPARLLLEIQELAQGDDHRLLLERIRTALKSPYLETSHITSMAAIAQAHNLRAVQRAILEVGRLRFPADSDFKRWLAESYIHSSDMDLKKRGVEALFDLLGIKRDGERWAITNKQQSDSGPTSLAVMMDYYRELEDPDTGITLLEAGLDAWPGDYRVLRNLALFFSLIQEMARADEYYRKALESNPTDDVTVSWYSGFLEKTGQYVEAYDMLCKARDLDPDDSRLSLALANYILGRGTRDELARGEAGAKSARVAAASPILREAIRAAHDPRIAFEAAQILARYDVAEAQKLLAPGPEGLAAVFAIDSGSGK